MSEYPAAAAAASRPDVAPARMDGPPFPRTPPKPTPKPRKKVEPKPIPWKKLGDLARDVFESYAGRKKK